MGFVQQRQIFNLVHMLFYNYYVYFIHQPLENMLIEIQTNVHFI